MKAILALDIGTSAAKAAVVSRDGLVLASRSAAYTTRTLADGQHEQHPEDWWNAACESVRGLGAGRFGLEAVILTGQMQDLIVLRGSRVVRPAILYSDGRSKREALEIENALGDGLTGITGNAQGATSLPAKLLWLERHEPETYRKADALLFGAHDYVAWRLTGTLAADRTTASTTGLLRLETAAWAVDALEQLGLRSDWLPRLRDSGEVLGTISGEGPARLGIPSGLPVLNGVGDAAAVSIGSGAGEPGRAYLYLGTSGWLASSTNGERGDPRRGVFTLLHPDRGATIQIGPMLTAGGNLEWVRAQLGFDHDDLDGLVSSAPIGSHGTVFLPYLAGERSPFMSLDARAEFRRISSATRRADLARAVLEGVAFGFRSIAEAMGFERRGQIFVAGGGARSNAWCQILADVLGLEIARLEGAEDVGVRGAAILAGRALGWHTSLFPHGSFFPSDTVFLPSPSDLERYEEAYRSWLELNPYIA